MSGETIAENKAIAKIDAGSLLVKIKYKK